MKKIVIFTLVSLVALVISSCDKKPRPFPKQTLAETESTEIIELIAGGKTHEFILYNRSKYSNGIAHWPDCRYCQTKND